MSQSSPRRLPELGPEAILDDLSIRQFLTPHRPIRDVLTDIAACPGAMDRAFGWLELDGAAAIGRLKRAELIQLARCLHRFWRAAAISEGPKSPQPA